MQLKFGSCSFEWSPHRRLGPPLENLPHPHSYRRLIPGKIFAKNSEVAKKASARRRVDLQTTGDQLGCACTPSMRCNRIPDTSRAPATRYASSPWCPSSGAEQVVAFSMFISPCRLEGRRSPPTAQDSCQHRGLSCRLRIRPRIRSRLRPTGPRPPALATGSPFGDFGTRHPPCPPRASRAPSPEPVPVPAPAPAPGLRPRRPSGRSTNYEFSRGGAAGRSMTNRAPLAASASNSSVPP